MQTCPRDLRQRKSRPGRIGGRQKACLEEGHATHAQIGSIIGRQRRDEGRGHEGGRVWRQVRKAVVGGKLRGRQPEGCKEGMVNNNKTNNKAKNRNLGFLNTFAVHVVT